MLQFLDVTAGISIISQAAPMASEITGASVAAAAGTSPMEVVPGVAREEARSAQ